MAEYVDLSDDQPVSKRTRNRCKGNVDPAMDFTERRTDDSLWNHRTKTVKQLNAHEIRDRHNLNAAQILDNEQLYQQQFDNLMARQLKYAKLTQQELNVLYLKYKFDRHYKPTENFVTFFHQQGMVNNRSHYDQFPDIQQRPGNSFDACNQSQYVHDNSKYISQGKENQYLYFNENYNHSNHGYKHYNTQPYNNAQNFDYSSDRIPASNEYYKHNSMNPSNTSQSCRYGDTTMLCDFSNLNQPYHNSQQNDMRLSNQYSNCAMNSNYDCHLNVWNNTSTANNTWSQSRNTQYYNQMEPCNKKNSSLYQFTRYNFEEGNDFNASNHNEAHFKSYDNYFNEHNAEQDSNNYIVNSFTHPEVPLLADAFMSPFTDFMNN